ncbi:MAG: tetratricopeptide repeat protein [Anaerolineales bacterium]|nr:tetratricopeptide repeat protein [Anaerolineales bacterium]
MKVKIWGARGSIPSPITPQAIREKLMAVLQGARGIDLGDPQAIRDYIDSFHPILTGTAGGNTSCVEVEAEGKTFIIDAGSGIRALGRELMKGPCGRGRGEVYLLFSHLHWDHIQGLPFFTPLYVPGNKIHLIGVHEIEQILKNQMMPPTFPVTYEAMKADLLFEHIGEEEVYQVGEVTIKNMKLPHPGDAYAYRFEFNDAVVVYASDAEYKKIDEASTRPYIQFFSGADVLFFDAQFSLRDALVKYEDWGHSSALIGVDMARKARAKRLILFHHDPVTTDQELVDILEQTLTYQQTLRGTNSCEVLIGEEGLTFELEPVKVFALKWGTNNESVVLQISDEFDQNHVAEVLQEAGREASAWGGGARLPRLVVDLSGVTQLNISGLRALIDLRRHWEGRPMALTGLSPSNYKVIELANFLDLFAIYPSVRVAQSALEAGDTLRLRGQLLSERYQIETLLGESDLSTVFKATDTRLDRPVAIKVLSPTLGQSAVKRLLTKARQMARLQAPNVVTIFDWAEDQGLAYLVMEYIEGQSLRDLMNKGSGYNPMDIAVDILYALEYAHNKGAVNGNLKPENVMVSDEVKLIDFGLWWAEDGQRLTELPFLLGDAYYLAPEQIEGRGVDIRTDLYAFGLILYELFTGRKPFLGEIRYVLEKHLYQKPITPRQINPNISRSLEHLILKLLNKEPDQRYETASQVRQILLGLEVTPEAQVISRSMRPAVLPGGDALNRMAVGSSRRQLIVEREPELEQLLRLWDLAQIGRGQMVLVGGEAGVGKSFLVEQLGVQAEGAVMLIGQCGEMELGSPYQPFIDILREYLIRRASLDGLEHLDDDANILVTLIPQIRQFIPNLPELPPLEPEQERSRLMRSISELIKRASNTQPWLLVIDNLQWIDPASMRVLFYLFRNISSTPILIVGLYRDIDVNQNHPLFKLDQELSRYPNYQKMSIRRLTKEGVLQLLETTWNTEIPMEWVDAIFNRTGGNPFYVKEVIKGLVEENVVLFREGKWVFRPIGDVKLPKSVRDTVMSRLARLRENTQELIRRASVLGQQFSMNDLLAVSDVTEEGMFDALDEALERNILREVEGGAMLAFTHADVQQVIYEELSTHRRKVLHRHIGEVLETRYTNNLPPVANQLANHFIQAQETLKAVMYCLEAAHYAQKIYAYQNALHWFRQAENLLPESKTPPESYIDLYEGLGSVLVIQARYSEASRAYNTMFEAAQGIENLNAQARALCGLSQVQDDLGDYSAALDIARRAVETAEASEDANENAKALVVLGWMEYKIGHLDEATQVAEQVLDLSTSLDARMEVAQSLNLMGVINDALGNYAKAITYFQKALDLYKYMDNRNQVGYMLNNLGDSARQRGDYQKSIRYYQDALSIAREIGDRDGEITFLSNLGAAKVGIGEYSSAEQDLRKVIEALEATGWGGLGETYYHLSIATAKQGNVNDALAAAEKALALGQEREQSEFVGQAWRALGMISAQAAHPVTLGERRYTGRLLGGDTGKLIRSRYTGELHHYQPHECFKNSLDIFTELEIKRERAFTLREWALYELNKGHKDVAQQYWHDAREIFKGLRLDKELERMDESVFNHWQASTP